ncbi:MAG: helix-turn-helix transcriptional regulator [Bacteroidota bacterium]
MTDRILEILKTKKMTPAQFADQIEVQRSSISHLVSGRNKPSLEFIQKILKCFPDINSDWLLFGQGSMLHSTHEIQLPRKEIETEVQSQTELFEQEMKPMEEDEKQIPPKKSETERVVKRKVPESEGKKVEKIVFFYKDNTFREFTPEG